MESKTQTCPYDGGALKGAPIPVEKKNGEKKKINMAVCASCGKRFIIRSSLPSSILLSDFKLIGHPLNKARTELPPVISSSGNVKDVLPGHTPQAVREMVRSTSYGIGEVIQRYESPANGSMIRIRFDIGDKEYVEKKAFDSGALVRI